MIRYSKKSDIRDIVFLWKEAFGDSEEDIMFFIDKKYKPENTVVYEENGRIASLLFLLEGEMQINGKWYPSYYLYAACTLNECRGRGYMSLLLKFAEEAASERGKYFICLLPASDSLYKYYEKYGYKAVFKKKILKFSPDDCALKADNGDSDFDNIFNLRQKAFGEYDMFIWDKESIEFAFDHHKLYGGQALTNCKGYMLYSRKGDKTYVKEFCFTDISDITYGDAREITMHLPADYPIKTGNYEIVDSGMLLPINGIAESLLKIIKNPYLGLTLD